MRHNPRAHLQNSYPLSVLCTTKQRWSRFLPRARLIALTALRRRSFEVDLKVGMIPGGKVSALWRCVTAKGRTKEALGLVGRGGGQQNAFAAQVAEAVLVDHRVDERSFGRR